MSSLSAPTQIFSLTNYKKEFSLYFDCCLWLSEVYPVQQYPIVCLQDEHRKGFWVKPRVDSRRNSHRRRSGVSPRDNLREHKTGAAYVSNNLVGISERVKRKMWRGNLRTAGSNQSSAHCMQKSVMNAPPPSPLLPTWSNVPAAGNLTFCWFVFFMDDTCK